MKDDKLSADDKKDTDGEDKMPDYDEETKTLIAGQPCAYLPLLMLNTFFEI